MTAPSGRLEAGEVTEEQRALAIDVLYGGARIGYDVKWPAVNELGERITYAIAAAERRGAERVMLEERVQCIGVVQSFYDDADFDGQELLEDIVAAIRAMGKP